jgi:two-component system chemotaxis response regulator CheB
VRRRDVGKIEGGVLQYRCHVGHAFTETSMSEGHNGEVEAALWSALRMLQENAALNLRLPKRAEGNGTPEIARRFGERVEEARSKAEAIRRLLVGQPRV